jgi:ABC-type cobalamin/Fe3+-siderophores transport system ATPase subunit
MIDLEIKNYRCFTDSSPVRLRLQPGLTALLGVNNSGKSSILRFFYEFRQLFRVLADERGTFLAALQNDGGFGLVSVLDQNEVFSNQNDRDILIELKARPNGGPVQNGLKVRIPRGTGNFRIEAVLTESHSFSRHPDLRWKFNPEAHLQRAGTQLTDFTYLFDACREISNALYIGSFRNVINVGTKQAYYDIDVGEAFISAWREFKSGKVKAKNEAALRVIEEIRHIFDFADLDINASPDGQTLQLFINRKSYWLSEQGSGLAQFILVLVNAAVKQPAYILIDEPELNLHPTLQMDFLTTLASYAPKGLLFATHSYGLARASADRIYSLHRTPTDVIVRELESTPRLSEFLGELSYSGYKELGFDKVLLVEGTTEIRTAHQFLRQYKKDHKIVVLSLGGSNMINGGRALELEEIKRITNNVAVLIDSERENAADSLKPDRQAFVKVCADLGFELKVLDRRATENYMTDRAVKSEKGPDYNPLGPFEKLTGAKPHWRKDENWRIARGMTKAELDGTDLGPFFEKL